MSIWHWVFRCFGQQVMICLPVTPLELYSLRLAVSGFPGWDQAPR